MPAHKNDTVHGNALLSNELSSSGKVNAGAWPGLIVVAVVVVDVVVARWYIVAGVSRCVFVSTPLP